VNELGSTRAKSPRPVRNHENAHRVLCSFPSLPSPDSRSAPCCAVSPLRSPPSSREEKPPPGSHRSPTTADPKFRTPEPRLPAQAPTECDASASAGAPAPFAYLLLSRLQDENSQIPNTLAYTLTSRLRAMHHLLQWAVAAENSLLVWCFFFLGFEIRAGWDASF